MIAAFIISAMALVPGLPKIPFLLIGTSSALLGRVASKSQKGRRDKRGETPQTKAEAAGNSGINQT